MAWLCKNCGAVASDRVVLEAIDELIEDFKTRGDNSSYYDPYCPDCISTDLEPVIIWNEKTMIVNNHARESKIRKDVSEYTMEGGEERCIPGGLLS